MTQLSNYVQLIGHVGNDLQLEESKNGHQYVKISLATNESYQDKSGNWENKTQWHKLVCWGKLAARINQQIQKGDQILVRGKLEHRKYEDSNKQTRNFTQVIIDSYVPMKKKEVV